MKRKKNRIKIFDSFNMLVSLNIADYKILNEIKKKIKKKLIIWTYPQIRLDGSFSNNFLLPLHKDEWVLDKNKKGYVLFPINREGGSAALETIKKKI